MATNKSSKWSNEDIENLKLYYGIYHRHALRQKLNRSTTSIHKKAKELGIKSYTRFSAADYKFIANNLELSPESIALKLKRSLQAVEQIIQRKIMQVNSDGSNVYSSHLFVPDRLIPVIASDCAQLPLTQVAKNHRLKLSTLLRLVALNPEYFKADSSIESKVNNYYKCSNCGKFLIPSTLDKRFKYCSNKCRATGQKIRTLRATMRYKSSPKGKIADQKDIRRNDAKRRLHYMHTPAGKLNLVWGSMQNKNRYPVACTKEQFIQFYKGIHCCEYCGINYKAMCRYLKAPQGKAIVNWSVDRKDTTKPYTLENMVGCCIRCNFIKSYYLDYEQMKELGPLAAKIFQQTESWDLQT